VRVPKSLIGDKRGGVAVMAAISATLFCGLGALAVDAASIALDARRLQGAADLAAMSAVLDLSHAQAAARATAVDNLGSEVTVAVITGQYRADPAKAPADRFTATPANGAPDAVRVVLGKPTPLFFGRVILGRSSVDLTRQATAATQTATPRAMFSIGSRLAGLNGGLANQLLTGLTGSSVSLTVMDYNGLAGADVNLLKFSDALAVELGVTAGDYDTLLKRDIKAGRALKVLEAVAGNQASSALSKLSQAALNLDLKLSDLIGVEAGAPNGLGEGLDANVSALDLATALLEVSAGNRQVALNLGVQAGIADLKTSLAIGERPNRSPWLTVTAKGEPIIRTAQARLYVRARTAQSLQGLAQVNLPILIELASSEAKLKSITCNPKRAVTLDVRPGLAKATIGAVDETRLGDFKRPLTPAPATLLSVLGLISLTGRAEVEAADQTYTSVPFSDADIKAQKTKSVQARGLVNGVVVSLLQRLDVDVNIIGLGLGLGGIVQALGVLLSPLGPVLDAAINPVFDLLGLRFGEADVQVLGASCPRDGGRAALVG